MRKFFTLSKILLFLVFSTAQLQAQVNMTTTGNYVQNFNSMAATGTGNAWLDNSTIPSWYAQKSTSGAIAAYNAGDGSSNTGALYSFGTGANTERSLGTVGSGTPGNFAYGVQLRNVSGAVITDLKVSYTLEQWRNGGNATQQNLTVYYKKSSSPITTLNPNVNGTWTAIPALTLTGPIATATAAALNGNDGLNKVSLANISIPGLTLADNEYIMIKWDDPDNSGTDHGLGIDDVTISWTVPPSSNADLSSLVITDNSSASVAITPSFTASTTTYSAASALSNSVSSVVAGFTKANAFATVQGRINGGAYGDPLVPFALNVGTNTLDLRVTAEDGITVKTYSVNLTRNAQAVPVLSQGSPLAAFGSICTGSTAGPNSFTLNGVDLDGSNISIAALPGFSFSENAGGPYTATLSFAAGSGISGKVIYVQFIPAAVQSYDGTIIVSGGGAPSVAIAVSASGINSTAGVSTGGSTVVGTSATLNGSLSGIGCSAVTSYGFEYSTVPGFANGTGTQVNGSNLSSGNFSVVLSGLSAGITYYYKAFATNSGGTAYGSQASFTTSFVTPVVMSAQPLFRYTQNFNDISAWGNNFSSGTGAMHFGAVDVNATGSIPGPSRITVSSASFSSGSSGGIQKGSGNLVFLSTNATDNLNAVAVDFYMDFTGMNAGTLSFDWASVNNSTGDRKASLRVYATVDGINFTELTAANVLNVTNNVPSTGIVNNIALPAIFNNSATARLRFYNYNGTGGTIGSRPKISIDNLAVSGVPSSPCTTPTAGATGLVFGTPAETSVTAGFTAASPAVHEYLVVMSTSSSLTSNPIDGQAYNIGDEVGDGDVVAKGSATSFTVTGLTGATTYYFFIFPLNSVCTGGPLYAAPLVLIGNTTTAAGLPPCTAPVNQATALSFGAVGVNSIQGSFTPGAGQEYLVLQSTNPSFSGALVNGQVYNAGNTIGNAVVIQRSANTSFTASGLTPNTQYYYSIFSLNSQGCLNGPAYNAVSPLTGSQTTQPLPVCATPSAQPSNLVLNAANTSATGTFNAVTNGNNYYLVVRSASATLSATPADNTDYNIGDNLGGGVVVGNTGASSFSTNGLTPTTTYYFFVFTMDKNCTGGTKYLTISPLTGSTTTTSTPPNNYYFGTLHSHSDYSDGQKDNAGGIPTQAWEYAANSLNMDFLGIAEHNHFSNSNNPGNELANYHAGVVQAINFNSTHSNFLALYGMEWGVISGGGHVLVYGDQMNDLFGWESNINGNTGPNYDVYVPKNTYTGPDGLFKTINDYVAKNTFASLAHPNNTDFNNLSNLPYDVQADNAISAVSVESGPANSQNTTYSDPGSSMASLWYYQKLLSKGYHLGPTIDHDNHYTTFGRTTKSRTAVLAPALTQTELMKAIRDMRFYATQDYDTKVDFTINTRVMGSIFEDLNAPGISVNISDATTSHSNAVIKVMFGVPGSDVLPVELYSVTGSTLNFVDNSLPVNGTGYYYIDITNGTTRTVTSPIWYTRKCALTTAFTATACGSYTWQGTLYTTSTVATKSFTTTSGCDSTVTMTLTITPGPVTNINTGENFCTIQAGINDPQTLDYHTLEVQSGNYNEQVLVNKRLVIKGVGPTQPVINFTGTPTGKKTVVDISKPDVTLDNFNIKADLVKLSSGIIVSGTAVSNLVLTNNKVDAYGSSAAASTGGYSDRNAVSINYSGATNYRIASGGVFNVTFTGNTVTGVVNDGFGQPRYFRSGVSADETSGSFSNNNLQSINHDVLARFGNNGAISVTNNIFNGGGVELSDMNAGSGPLTVSGNSFNSAFANTAAPNTAVMRLKNNYNARNTTVTNNTFTDHEWAVSMENYNTVNINNNSFTPLAGSVTYHHIVMNTKAISTGSATIVQKPIDGIIRSNTFNGSGATGGTAVTFMNHDNDAAVVGPIVLGGPGFENNFNAGIKTFIALDHQSGPSGAASFPLYPSVIGTGANAVTTMAPWTVDIFGVNNRYDVGAGLELPSTMSISNLFALEDRIQHKIDANTLGFVTIKVGNDYVTTNSFLAPVSTAASVQRGVNAAANGFTVNVGPGVFADNITINKSVTVSGQGQATTRIVPAVSNPDCGGSGGGSICPGGSNVILVQANNVTIQQLTVDGNNPAISSSTIAGGVDIDARNGIITDHTTGMFNNLTVSDVTVQNIFLRGMYASSGGTFTFQNNTVDNVQGNTSSIGIFNFGGSGNFLNNTVTNTNDGIASNWSKGSFYVGNKVSGSGSGIHSDNNGGQGGTADLIVGNQVFNSKPNGYGIWVFAPYVATQVTNNLVTNVDVGMAAAGQQAAVTPIFANNTVDGQNKANSTGMYITTSLFGFGSSNVSVLFQNNFVRNNADGFYLESEPGMNLSLEAHNNSFTGNTNSQVTGAGTGTIAANMECNWWGTVNNAAIAASIMNAPSVDYSPRLTNGTDVAPVPGFQPTPSCADPINTAQVTATTNVNCYGASTGSATIVFNNGVPPASYSLNGGAPVNIATVPFTITGLAAGSHTVVITDAAGNSVSVSFSITQPATALSAMYSATPIPCYGGLSTESITINGGTAPYNVHNQGGGALIIGAGEGITYHGSTYAANYTYTVTDAKGCQYVFNAQITQPDPLVVQAVATDILCNNGTATVTVTANGGTAPYSGTGSFNAAAGTYTYTVTDANGCTASATVTVNQVTDETAPAITAPAAVSVTADAGSCSALSVTLGTPVTSDNCGVASIINNAPAAFPVGVTTVTWTVTDNSGNTASATQTVTVTDNEKPKITAPYMVSVPNDDGQCGASISSLGIPAVSDNCGVASVTNNHPSTYFPVGTTIVTWTVTDIHGNIVDTATQVVTVIDNEMPVINVSNISVSNDAGVCGANLTLAAPGVSDNCGIASVTNDHPSSFFPVGSTQVKWTVTDISGYQKHAFQTIVVTDTEKPVVNTQNITVSLDAGGTAAITAAQINNGSTDNCAIASVTLSKTSFNCSNLGVNTVTITVTDVNGNSKSETATVTVVDNLAPAITTAVPAQSFCSNAGSYTIPSLGVTDNCGVSTVTYSITGATSRNGTGVNASGTFNTGTSTITWTVKDAAGNMNSSSATVTVTMLSVPVITASAPDAFCNKLTVTATSNNNGASYKWMLGSSTVAVTPQLHLGLTNADGTYTVTVTAGGCTSAAASYQYQKQNLASSYTILTYKNVSIGKYNKVSTGSVGVMTSKGKAEFGSNSAVNGPGSFVKAPKIEKDGYNININSQINGIATVTLPSMQYNTASTKYLPNYTANTQNATLNGNYNTLTVKKNISITVTGSTFGTIKLEEGASIRFTNTVLNIDNFIAEKGAKDDHYSYVRFAAGTSVRISSKVSLGSQVWVNPDNGKLTFFMGDNKSDEEKFTISGGDTKVTANIYMPDGKLKVTATDVDDDRDACDHKAHNYRSCRHRSHYHNDCDHNAHNANDCGDDVYMTGVFIVEELESKGNTVIWNSYDCSSSPSPIVINSKTGATQKAVGETAGTTEEDLKITVMPNPSTTYFTLKFASRNETPLNLRVMDAQGRVVDSKSNIGANSTLQIGHTYSSGTYYAEVIQEGRRKVVQLIKARG